ncbi:MAG: toll/interleukin-1 receptor domain-containing protein [Novosphingobium sp.]
MEQDLVANAASRYRAFVSYSHVDARFAAWLHRNLETSRLPDGTRLAPIFIDRAELAAGPDLSSQVREALSESAALVVIASPAARASRWVGQEIALFRQLHPDRPVLAALTLGEPDESFPEALLSHAGAAVEPLAADFRKGQDGKRLGLLKLVAGLSAQPLDRLVQRDAQTRQRRVMAVTAGAVILSLVLSALLVVAIRARSEAERQRAEAEGLVEYMLTDLRDKLKGVGRLDVMDSVNERVMQRYEKEARPDLLPQGLSLGRARLLHAMAEDDFSRKLGWQRGMREAEEGLRITAAQLRKSPDLPAILAAHAQSEYWVGYGWFLKRSSDPKARERSRKHWLSYDRFASRLAETDPANVDWQIEAASATANLCALELAEKSRSETALNYCRRSRQRLEQIATLRPVDLNAQLNFSSSLAWEADALLAMDDMPEALKLRTRQAGLLDRLQAQYPLDSRVGEAAVLARMGLAKVLLRQGATGQAGQVLTRARSDLLLLSAKDPANSDWRSWLQQIEAMQEPIKSTRR